MLSYAGLGRAGQALEMLRYVLDWIGFVYNNNIDRASSWNFPFYIKII